MSPLLSQIQAEQQNVLPEECEEYFLICINYDDILNEYTSSYELIRVKTTNMGSMFKLTYNVILRDVTREKEMIDKIRCRNGNLEIVVSKQETVGSEL